MKVRRYFAANMRSALEMVRQEQGPDVLIVSNRKLDDGIELVTADGDIDEELVQQFSARAKSASKQRSAKSSVDVMTESPTPVPAPGDAAVKSETLVAPNGTSLWSDPASVVAMRRELNDLRGLLEQQLGGFAWAEYGNKRPVQARLIRALSRAGIAPTLARDLIVGMPDEVAFASGWELALDALASRLSVLDDPILSGGGRVVLCGPSGVGKTLIACKLAAQYALSHGTDSVALISMDDQRLGAQQQLKVFGGLLGVTVPTARNAVELQACLDRVADKDLVLIDTAGAPVDDIGLRELLTQLGRDDVPLESYLVLGANTDYQSLGRVLDATADLCFSGAIVTKLDEAVVLGPILSAVIEAELPIAYVSAGQQVPDDLEAPLSRPLIDRTVALANESPSADDPTVIERAFSAH